MGGMLSLFEIDPGLDLSGPRSRFARDGRVQIRDFLTRASAETVLDILARQTPWGLAWQAGEDGPHALRSAEAARLDLPRREALGESIAGAMGRGDFAFLYGHYPLLDAYLQRWGDCPPLELLLEHINAPLFLDLVREVTGIGGLIKADAQASLFAPTHFLSVHEDKHAAEGARVAYVMNFCAGEWRPDWGGYLLFYDEEGDVTGGFRPRFNALNLFLVPQRHSVAFVPPFAPEARFAISGWFRDR